MAVRFLGVPPSPQPPGSPAAAAFAGDRWPPRLAAARQTDCPPRCPTRSCPCATTLPAAGPAPPHCWSAPRRPPAQRSITPPTTCPVRGTAPPLCGLGSPAHAAVAAPFALGAGPAAGAAPVGRTPRL